MISFLVKDSGRGIPEGKLHPVFEMFVKSQQDHEGSGLGLYLVLKDLSFNFIYH